MSDAPKECQWAVGLGTVCGKPAVPGEWWCVEHDMCNAGPLREMESALAAARREAEELRAVLGIGVRVLRDRWASLKLGTPEERATFDAIERMEAALGVPPCFYDTCEACQEECVPPTDVSPKK